MSQNDDTTNVVSLHSDNTQEQGKCFLIVSQAITLDFKIPVPGREGVWTKRGFPYTSFDEYHQTPDGIEIITDRGIIIVIEGDDLDRLYEAIGDHKLRMIRPAQKGGEVKDGEPRPNKIIFIEPKNDDEKSDKIDDSKESDEE